MTPSFGLLLWLWFGLAAGSAHFALLRWNTALYVNGSAGRAIGVQILRMLATTALLGFAAWHGALPLLLAVAGVLLARPLVMRLAGLAP